MGNENWQPPEVVTMAKKMAKFLFIKLSDSAMGCFYLLNRLLAEIGVHFFPITDDQFNH